MGAASKPLQRKLGDAWEVPERSVVTTPSGDTYTFAGGVVILTETGTWSNDTGDRVTVKP